MVLSTPSVRQALLLPFLEERVLVLEARSAASFRAAQAPKKSSERSATSSLGKRHRHPSPTKKSLPTSSPIRAFQAHRNRHRSPRSCFERQQEASRAQEAPPEDPSFVRGARPGALKGSRGHRRADTWERFPAESCPWSSRPAAFALPPQALSDVIATPLGFHILRIESRSPAREEGTRRSAGSHPRRARPREVGRGRTPLCAEPHDPGQGENRCEAGSYPSFLACPCSPAAVGAEIIERVVVKVNGEIVTLTEFQSRQLRALQQARVTPENVPTYLREHNARLLQEAIDDLVLKQRAEDQGLRIPPQYLAEAIEEIKKDNKIPNDEQFIELLTREGMTLEDLKRDIERPMLEGGGHSSRSRIQVTRHRCRRSSGVREEQGEVHPPDDRHPPRDSHEGRERRARARALAERARNGEDFAALAREHSAAATKAQGGELGKIPKGELNPDFEKVAFALPVDGISEPIRCSDGWRIFKVSEKTEGGALEFDAAKDDIKRRLQVQRFATEYETYMADLRKNAVIDIRVREVPLQIDETGRLVETPILTPSLSAPGSTGTTRPSPNAPPEDEITTSGSSKPESQSPALPPTASPFTPPGTATPEAAKPSPSPR